MRGGRILSLFLLAAIFILQGGDCVSLFFADKQAHDCCNKGHCSRKNPDPCCQVSAKTNITHDQAKDKVQFVELAVWTMLPVWTAPVHFVPLDPTFRHNLTLAPSPPGKRGNFSVPLLV